MCTHTQHTIQWEQALVQLTIHMHTRVYTGRGSVTTHTAHAWGSHGLADQETAPVSIWSDLCLIFFPASVQDSIRAPERNSRLLSPKVSFPSV